MGSSFALVYHFLLMVVYSEGSWEGGSLLSMEGLDPEMTDNLGNRKRSVAFGPTPRKHSSVDAEWLIARQESLTRMRDKAREMRKRRDSLTSQNGNSSDGDKAVADQRASLPPEIPVTMPAPAQESLTADASADQPSSGQSTENQGSILAAPDVGKQPSDPPDNTDGPASNAAPDSKPAFAAPAVPPIKPKPNAPIAAAPPPRLSFRKKLKSVSLAKLKKKITPRSFKATKPPRPKPARVPIDPPKIDPTPTPAPTPAVSAAPVPTPAAAKDQPKADASKRSTPKTASQSGDKSTSLPKEISDLIKYAGMMFDDLYAAEDPATSQLGTIPASAMHGLGIPESILHSAIDLLGVKVEGQAFMDMRLDKVVFVSLMVHPTTLPTETNQNKVKVFEDPKQTIPIVRGELVKFGAL